MKTTQPFNFQYEELLNNTVTRWIRTRQLCDKSLCQHGCFPAYDELNLHSEFFLINSD